MHSYQPFWTRTPRKQAVLFLKKRTNKLSGSAVAPWGTVRDSPAPAGSLPGLPPAFVAVGALDPFLDEDLADAQRLLRAGVPTGLHVIPAAFHGFGLAGGRRVSGHRHLRHRRAGICGADDHAGAPARPVRHCGECDRAGNTAGDAGKLLTPDDRPFVGFLEMSRRGRCCWCARRLGLGSPGRFFMLMAGGCCGHEGGCRGLDGKNRDSPPKVFWFFFSKKNCLPCLPLPSSSHHALE